MLFSEMSSLNKASLAFFVLAKLTGIFGISLGFLGKDFLFFGGVLLSMAIFSIFLSIFLSLIQTFKDKKIFSEQDEEKNKIKMYKETKKQLEKQILSLQEQKRSLENMMIRKGKFS